MKTTIQRNEASAPANVRPSSVSNSKNSESLHRIDYRQRFYNRRLSTAGVLDLLYDEAPEFWELAEVVGKWVWIQFAGKQPRQITAALSEFGFHWNNRRQVWQHPCGQIINRADFDPRRKYRSYFAADMKPV